MRAGPVYRPFQKALGTISRVLLPLVDTKKPQPALFQVLNCWLNAGGCQLAREQACPEPNKHGRVFLFRDPTRLKASPLQLLLRLLLLLLLLLLQLPQPLQRSGTTATLLLLLMSLLLLLVGLPLQLLLLLLLPPLLLLCCTPTPCPDHCYSCYVAATATAALQKSGDSQLQRQQ